MLLPNRFRVISRHRKFIIKYNLQLDHCLARVRLYISNECDAFEIFCNSSTQGNRRYQWNLRKILLNDRK